MSNLQKYIEGGQVAAMWLAWLSAITRKAIQRWCLLKIDAIKKLKKIGQGTYSSVFRANGLEIGRILALKNVHYDNFEPVSV